MKIYDARFNETRLPDIRFSAYRESAFMAQTWLFITLIEYLISIFRGAPDAG